MIMKQNRYIEAYALTQHAVEKILWDRFVGVFQGQKASQVRARIDGELSRYIMTEELITWTYIIEGINDSEYRELRAFNKQRNRIMHGHGNWWNVGRFKESLNKAVTFLEMNGFA